MTNAVVHTAIKRITANGVSVLHDIVATEEPLEIRLVHGPLQHRRQQHISVTMRTPGQDKELVAGFLLTEGIISAQEDILNIALTTESDGSIATVHLKVQAIAHLDNIQRNYTSSAACGLCGKTTLAAIRTCVPVNYQKNFQFPAATLYGLPAMLRNGQKMFDATGGLHAAALFDATGALLLLREDIGRHNAVDKIIGAAMAQQLMPLQTQLLLLSGRAGFELVQKAAMAGITIIAAIGAPSSMAVQMANEWNITLIGFLKDQHFNIYSAEERIQNTI